MKKLSIPATGMLLLFLAACNSNSEQKKSMESTRKTWHQIHLCMPAPCHFRHLILQKSRTVILHPPLKKASKEHLAEIDTIANNPEAPTFENTLVAMEKSGELLRRVNGVFNMLSGANTDSVLQKLSEDIAPKLAAQQDAIYLNKNFTKESKPSSKRKMSSNWIRNQHDCLNIIIFNLYVQVQTFPHDNKTKLKKLNEEEAGLGAKFTNQLLAAAKAGGLS